jgi:hypothetical protein
MPIDDQGYPVVPHEFIRGVDCDGYLVVEKRGELADLVCNECGEIVRTLVPLNEVELVLAEMLFRTGEVTSHECPPCGHLNVLPGFSEMKAYVCFECGEGVSVD